MSRALLERPFITVVELFPPLVPSTPGGRAKVDLADLQRRFVDSVRPISRLADCFLVADLKDPSQEQISPVQSAAILKAELGLDAAPVVVARDGNKRSVATSVVTAFALGIDSIFLAWGDRYSGAAQPANVYDYGSLAELISETRALSRTLGIDAAILAPVDLSAGGGGPRLGRKRLAAGADLLIAQPPTTDSTVSLSAHETILRGAGLSRRVLLGAFPFRGQDDARQCAEKFGWQLPPQLFKLAARGRRALDAENRRVVKSARERGLRGVCVSTRGEPRTAAPMLA